MLYKNAKVCLRSILGKCELLPIPRGPGLESSLTSGSLTRLAQLLSACEGLRGSASMSAMGQTVQTVRVRRCCGRRSTRCHRFPRVRDLVVKMSVTHRLHHRGVSRHLGRHLSRKVMGRIGTLLSDNVSSRSLVCCKLRCGCLALCILNGLSFGRVFRRLRVTVRRFTGQRVA